MSWFKSTAEGERSMSNVPSDSRSPRTSEPRLWESELKGLPPATASPVPAPRADAKPAAEPARPARPPVAESKPATESASAPAPAATAAAAAAPVGSVFGPTLRFKGELRADEDFVLQGRIEGSIHHTQNLTIGTDGVVKGDSRARSIIVEGTVEGDLYALESISIRPTARVLGNLLAPRVAIADGAHFNGKVDMASATRAVRSITDRQSATSEERTLNLGTPA
jgi:cytoskeletal protein CcmA (bactofilin family)